MISSLISFLSSEMLNEPTQTEQEIDAAALKKLCDMGFPQNRAKKALLLNRYMYLIYQFKCQNAAKCKFHYILIYTI